MARNEEIKSLHVVGKSPLKRWPVDHQRSAWRIFSKVINGMQKENNLSTRAFVLMSNHYHWLCEFDYQGDPSFFEWFHEVINFYFLDDGKNNGNTLEFRPQVIQLDNRASYINTYKYIYRNPVEAGLVYRAQDYSYSTLKYMLGSVRKPFPIDDNMNLIADPYRLTKWINDPWGEQLYFRYY